MDLEDLGRRVRRRRQERGLSVERLGALSDVSAGMISSIERGQKAPTVILLDRIAVGLGTTLAALLEPPEPPRAIHRRAEDQDIVIEDGWRRTILSPVVPSVNFEWIETVLPPGIDAGEYPAYAAGSHEYIVVVEGQLTLTLDDAVYELDAGDSLYFAADVTHHYANRGTVDCRYYVAAIIARPRSRKA